MMPSISLSTRPESLKLSVWSKSLASRYCFINLSILIALRFARESRRNGAQAQHRCKLRALGDREFGGESPRPCGYRVTTVDRRWLGLQKCRIPCEVDHRQPSPWPVPLRWAGTPAGSPPTTPWRVVLSSLPQPEPTRVSSPARPRSGDGRPGPWRDRPARSPRARAGSGARVRRDGGSGSRCTCIIDRLHRRRALEHRRAREQPVGHAADGVEVAPRVHLARRRAPARAT